MCVYINIYIIYISKYYQIQSSGSNDFGQHGATALGSALRHLQVLDVRMNHIGDPGAAWRGGKSRAPAEWNLDGLQLGHTWSTYIYLYNLILTHSLLKEYMTSYEMYASQSVVLLVCSSHLWPCGVWDAFWGIVQIPTSQSSLDGKIWQEAVV